MRKKMLGLLLVLAALLGALGWFFWGRGIYTQSGVTLDASRRDEGYVTVSAVNEKRLKARLTREGEEYTYDLPGDGTATVYPLSQGPGEYTVTVYESTGGNRYKPILKRTLKAGFEPRDPFLRPNQMVNYTPDSAAVQKAAELTAGLTGDVEKIDAVLNFVTETLTYDTAKAGTVESGYISDVDAALDSGTGICQDYAALTAAMLRSLGIPCKMEVGWAGEEYHAWVRVWSEEAGELSCGVKARGGQYTLLDPTFLDSGGEKIVEYVADTTHYRTEYTY